MNPIEAAKISLSQLGNIHIVSLQPGAIRGNHYHVSTEWIVVFGGKARFLWKPLDGTEIKDYRIEGGDPVMFEIRPSIIHSLQNLSDHEIFLISLNDSHHRGTVSAEPLTLSGSSIP